MMAEQSKSQQSKAQAQDEQDRQEQQQSRHPELRVGPLDPAEHTDPADPRDVNQFVGPTGVLSSALDLVQAQQAVYADIGPALALPRVEERSHPDYLDLDEVQKAAGIDDDDGQVVGAAVRGDQRDTRRMIVTYTVEWADDGRHSKGRLPYDKLSKSKKLYDDREHVDPNTAAVDNSRLQRRVKELEAELKAAKS
jgi:hypothetical protein